MDNTRCVGDDTGGRTGSREHQAPSATGVPPRAPLSPPVWTVVVVSGGGAVRVHMLVLMSEGLVRVGSLVASTQQCPQHSLNCDCGADRDHARCVYESSPRARFSRLRVVPRLLQYNQQPLLRGLFCEARRQAASCASCWHHSIMPLTFTIFFTVFLSRWLFIDSGSGASVFGLLCGTPVVWGWWVPHLHVTFSNSAAAE